MNVRILLDPDPNSGGGAPATTPVPAATTPAPTPAPPPADPSAGLNTLLFQRLTAAETRAAELELADRQRQTEAARRDQDALAARGDADNARAALTAAREAADRDLAAARAETDSERNRARNAFRDRELALALSAHQLNKGAATQLMNLLRAELEAHPEGDSYAVRTKDFVSVNDFVARQLAHEDYAHFLQPTTTGGAGATGTNRPAPATPGETADARQARQLKEAMIAERGGSIGILAHANSRN
jgi:hypothetical protein